MLSSGRFTVRPWKSLIFSGNKNLPTEPLSARVYVNVLEIIGGLKKNICCHHFHTPGAFIRATVMCWSGFPSADFTASSPWVNRLTKYPWRLDDLGNLQLSIWQCPFGGHPLVSKLWGKPTVIDGVPHFWATFRKTMSTGGKIENDWNHQPVMFD